MQRLVGPVMSRAIVYFDGQFFSPVYGHQVWFREVIHEAGCAIGCTTVPGDRHQGCGFHGHWDIDETKKFVEQIRGTADCITLLECFGDIALHAKGGRAQRGRIVAVLDWDPYEVIFAPTIKRDPRHRSVPPLAANYFNVPMLGINHAQEWIATQAERNGIRLVCEDGRWSYPMEPKV